MRCMALGGPHDGTFSIEMRGWTWDVTAVMAQP